MLTKQATTCTQSKNNADRNAIFFLFFLPFFFTFVVLVPEFLMAYRPSCGGIGLSLNNLRGQRSSYVTAPPHKN